MSKSKIPRPVAREEVQRCTTVDCHSQTDLDASGKSFNQFSSGFIQKDGLCEAWTQVDSVVKNDVMSTTTETFHPILKDKSTNTNKKTEIQSLMQKTLLVEPGEMANKKKGSLCGAFSVRLPSMAFVIFSENHGLYCIIMSTLIK